jgi:uncharacterized membrane protein YccF (DUF307 family)
MVLLRCLHEPAQRVELLRSSSRTFVDMRLLLNVVWLVFSGIWMAIAYCVLGALVCLTVVGIPFGIAAFRIANYALWPFGRDIVRRADHGAASTLGNLVWFLLAGLWLAIGHVISGVILCLTVIGIPLGLANFKMIPVSLTPLGREIVSGR